MNNAILNEKPIFQIRDFRDGTWSVTARIYTPEKKFYEHPTHINLTENEAKIRCQECIDSDISTGDVLKTWEYIGN